MQTQVFTVVTHAYESAHTAAVTHTRSHGPMAMLGTSLGTHTCTHIYATQTRGHAHMMVTGYVLQLACVCTSTPLHTCCTHRRTISRLVPCA